MTDRANIETSSSGLRLSYVHFISDSAPGFAVILLIGFIWPHRLTAWSKDTEFRILFAALLFILATPVGLVINAVSYFLLGHIQAQINRICFLSRGWPVRTTRRSFWLDETTARFAYGERLGRAQRTLH